MRTTKKCSNHPVLLFAFVFSSFLFSSSYVFSADKVVVIPLNSKTGGTTITVLDDFTCSSLSSVTTTYAKVLSIGSFIQNGENSTVEITFHGTLMLSTSTGYGAHFELRVDDTASNNGRAIAAVTNTEIGSRVHASMTGIFTNLGSGLHTVSIWARAPKGSGTGAGVSPGCYEADHVIVKEFL